MLLGIYKKITKGKREYRKKHQNPRLSKIYNKGGSLKYLQEKTYLAIFFSSKYHKFILLSFTINAKRLTIRIATPGIVLQVLQFVLENQFSAHELHTKQITKLK